MMLPDIGQYHAPRHFFSVLRKLENRTGADNFWALLPIPVDGLLARMSGKVFLFIVISKNEASLS